jgi:hypothetical protein
MRERLFVLSISTRKGFKTVQEFIEYKTKAASIEAAFGFS